MIAGIVNARLEATLKLQIEEATGYLHTIDTSIDTGFNGDLTLRPAKIASLALPVSGTIISQLADGSVLQHTAHDAILWWDGSPVLIEVQAVETDSLLGTGLLKGYELKVAFVHGGAVTIERIP